MQINQTELARITSLSNAKGPSGFEEGSVAIIRQSLDNGLFTIEEDSLRNLYIRRKKDKGDKPVLMLDAHSDEVGFMVHSIKPNGTLRFVELGGWNASTLPGMRVFVKTSEGNWTPGIIAAKPPHFMTEAERKSNSVQPVSALVIDIGAVSAEDAINNFKIRIGEPITADVSFYYDEKHDVMHGKAFDCRIGCAAQIETLLSLAAVDLDVDLVGVFSSQEEVGERGCKAAVNRVDPDLAICFEGCPADDTFSEPYAIQTALHKGPMLRFMDTSIICNPRFQRFSLNLAEEKGLMAQCSVREGGGNDGAVIQTLLRGAPSIVMGVPVRYIHSANCITSYADYRATVDLAVTLIKAINKEVIGTF